MKVMKFGGGCLRDSERFQLVAEVLKSEASGPTVLVVSAVFGVTNLLERAIDAAVSSEENIPMFLDDIRGIHEEIVSDAIDDISLRAQTRGDMVSKIQRLERLLYGVSYLGEVSETTRVMILSQGERIAAALVAAVLRDRGIPSIALEADKIGMITDDSCDNATAVIPSVRSNISERILPLLEQDIVPVITGYFGCREDGKVSSFGRNGSDYSAAVIAAVLEASSVHIWKDVDGFMTADPKMIHNATRIERLSYTEAAELSYFGARVLHPRTVEPLAGTGVDLYIRNITSSSGSMTLIEPNGYQHDGVIKSVTFNDQLAVLRIHGAGVGHKPGIIGEVGRRMSAAGINIYSIITSQTCINLLLDSEQACLGVETLRPLVDGVIERTELRDNICLIAVVGEGLLKKEGLAARLFSSVARHKINIEMFAAGASDVALYFIVNKDDMYPAIDSVHHSFFGNE